MDDVTILLQTAACTNRLLKRLKDLFTWARMKKKPSKSRSLSIRKGARKDNISFSVNGEAIPRLIDQPVKSLGRLYTAEISDKHMAVSVTTQLTSGLKKIDESLLPGKFKVWCYQFTQFHRLLWPLKLCDITSSTVLKMDAKANNYIRKWLGLPRCLSTSALFGKNTLRLPMETISFGYKLEKNLHRWYGTEELCQLCGHQSPSLQHILSGCKTALTQGRYGWHHDRVLRKLAEVIEGRRLEVNKANVCHAYQIAHQNGIPDSRIVVMMYDDIAYNKKNPYPGKIINKPNGSNVYPGVPKDYTGEDVTAGNFLAALKGDTNAVKKRKPKVIKRQKSHIASVVTAIIYSKAKRTSA
ncbi:hypothetical protein ROHU_012346 [Labeo rohita]|uniref:Reverse transcriptase zinc-binding domain-containing protein n=1 Tax=Labeo rohita TaxID=84645 RepID=A0A498LDS0_LABRO|nr:hypothetical protein ROHU_012346 [Labeo rohita]